MVHLKICSDLVNLEYRVALGSQGEQGN